MKNQKKQNDNNFVYTRKNQGQQKQVQKNENQTIYSQSDKDERKANSVSVLNPKFTQKFNNNAGIPLTNLKNKTTYTTQKDSQQQPSNEFMNSLFGNNNQFSLFDQSILDFSKQNGTNSMMNPFSQMTRPQENSKQSDRKTVQYFNKMVPLELSDYQVQNNPFASQTQNKQQLHSDTKQNEKQYCPNVISKRKKPLDNQNDMELSSVVNQKENGSFHQTPINEKYEQDKQVGVHFDPPISKWKQAKKQRDLEKGSVDYQQEQNEINAQIHNSEENQLCDFQLNSEKLKQMNENKQNLSNMRMNCQKEKNQVVLDESENSFIQREKQCPLMCLIEVEADSTETLVRRVQLVVMQQREGIIKEHFEFNVSNEDEEEDARDLRDHFEVIAKKIKSYEHFEIIEKENDRSLLQQWNDIKLENINNSQSEERSLSKFGDDQSIIREQVVLTFASNQVTRVLKQYNLNFMTEVGFKKAVFLNSLIPDRYKDSEGRIAFPLLFEDLGLDYKTSYCEQTRILSYFNGLHLIDLIRLFIHFGSHDIIIRSSLVSSVRERNSFTEAVSKLIKKVQSSKQLKLNQITESISKNLEKLEKQTLQQGFNIEETAKIIDLLGENKPINVNKIQNFKPQEPYENQVRDDNIQHLQNNLNIVKDTQEENQKSQYDSLIRMDDLNQTNSQSNLLITKNIYLHLDDNLMNLQQNQQEYPLYLEQNNKKEEMFTKSELKTEMNQANQYENIGYLNHNSPIKEEVVKDEINQSDQSQNNSQNRIIDERNQSTQNQDIQSQSQENVMKHEEKLKKSEDMQGISELKDQSVRLSEKMEDKCQSQIHGKVNVEIQSGIEGNDIVFDDLKELRERISDGMRGVSELREQNVRMRERVGDNCSNAWSGVSQMKDGCVTAMQRVKREHSQYLLKISQEIDIAIDEEIERTRNFEIQFLESQKKNTAILMNEIEDIDQRVSKQADIIQFLSQRISECELKRQYDLEFQQQTMLEASKMLQECSQALLAKNMLFITSMTQQIKQNVQRDMSSIKNEAEINMSQDLAQIKEELNVSRDQEQIKGEFKVSRDLSQEQLNVSKEFTQIRREVNMSKDQSQGQLNVSNDFTQIRGELNESRDLAQIQNETEMNVPRDIVSMKNEISMNDQFKNEDFNDLENEQSLSQQVIEVLSNEYNLQDNQIHINQQQHQNTQNEQILHSENVEFNCEQNGKFQKQQIIQYNNNENDSKLENKTDIPQGITQINLEGATLELNAIKQMNQEFQQQSGEQNDKKKVSYKQTNNQEDEIISDHQKEEEKTDQLLNKMDLNKLNDEEIEQIKIAKQKEEMYQEMENRFLEECRRNYNDQNEDCISYLQKESQELLRVEKNNPVVSFEESRTSNLQKNEVQKQRFICDPNEKKPLKKKPRKFKLRENSVPFEQPIPNQNLEQFQSHISLERERPHSLNNQQQQIEYQSTQDNIQFYNSQNQFMQVETYPQQSQFKQKRALKYNQNKQMQVQPDNCNYFLNLKKNEADMSEDNLRKRNLLYQKIFKKPMDDVLTPNIQHQTNNKLFDQSKQNNISEIQFYDNNFGTYLCEQGNIDDMDQYNNQDNLNNDQEDTSKIQMQQYSCQRETKNDLNHIYKSQENTVQSQLKTEFLFDTCNKSLQEKLLKTSDDNCNQNSKFRMNRFMDSSNHISEDDLENQKLENKEVEKNEEMCGYVFEKEGIEAEYDSYERIQDQHDQQSMRNDEYVKYCKKYYLNQNDISMRSENQEQIDDKEQNFPQMDDNNEVNEEIVCENDDIPHKNINLQCLFEDNQELTNKIEYYLFEKKSNEQSSQDDTSYEQMCEKYNDENQNIQTEIYSQEDQTEQERILKLLGIQNELSVAEVEQQLCMNSVSVRKSRQLEEQIASKILVEILLVIHFSTLKSSKGSDAVIEISVSVLNTDRHQVIEEFNSRDDKSSIINLNTGVKYMQLNQSQDMFLRTCKFILPYLENYKCCFFYESLENVNMMHSLLAINRIIPSPTSLSIFYSFMILSDIFPNSFNSNTPVNSISQAVHLLGQEKSNTNLTAEHANNYHNYQDIDVRMNGNHSKFENSTLKNNERYSQSTKLANKSSINDNCNFQLDNNWIKMQREESRSLSEVVIALIQRGVVINQSMMRNVFISNELNRNVDLFIKACSEAFENREYFFILHYDKKQLQNKGQYMEQNSGQFNQEIGSKQIQMEQQSNLKKTKLIVSALQKTSKSHFVLLSEFYGFQFDFQQSELCAFPFYFESYMNAFQINPDSVVLIFSEQDSSLVQTTVQLMNQKYNLISLLPEVEQFIANNSQNIQKMYQLDFDITLLRSAPSSRQNMLI